MLDTVDFNHVQHISFTQSLLTDAVSVILSELLSYEHPPKGTVLVFVNGSIQVFDDLCLSLHYNMWKVFSRENPIFYRD